MARGPGPGVRLLRAAVCVALAIAAVPASGAVLRAVHEGAQAGTLVRAWWAADGEGEDASAAASDASSDAASDAADASALAALAAGYAPEDADGTARAVFEAEALSLGDLQECRANDACTVVGFTVSASAAEVLDLLSEELAEKGWTRVESGSDAAVSFTKQTGALTWLLASCTEFADETAVVLRV